MIIILKSCSAGLNLTTLKQQINIRRNDQFILLILMSKYGIAGKIKLEMREILKVLLYLFIRSLFSCSNDTNSELSGNYFYRDEGGYMKEILSHSANRENIYGRIICYDYNSDFIIALQEPIFDEFVSMIGFNLRDDSIKYSSNSSEDIRNSEIEADSILKNDPYYRKIFSSKYNYWIISHKLDSVFGPLTKEEYLIMREEINIPNGVKLNQ